jgi:hypothetical protein
MQKVKQRTGITWADIFKLSHRDKAMARLMATKLAKRGG